MNKYLMIERARILAMRGKSATEGPWHASDERDGYGIIGDRVIDIETRESAGTFIMVAEGIKKERDADLIAAAPEMARLLDMMADELDKALKKVRG